MTAQLDMVYDALNEYAETRSAEVNQLKDEMERRRVIYNENMAEIAGKQRDQFDRAETAITNLDLLRRACKAEGYLADASDRTNNRICTALAILNAQEGK